MSIFHFAPETERYELCGTSTHYLVDLDIKIKFAVKTERKSFDVADDQRSRDSCTESTL